MRTKKPNGMQGELEQKEDRNQWHLAMAKRALLVRELQKHRVHLEMPHTMKIKDLEKMLKELREGGEAPEGAENPGKVKGKRSKRRRRGGRGRGGTLDTQGLEGSIPAASNPPYGTV